MAELQLLPILAALFFMVIFFALVFYIAIIGRIGLQFFKYNIPFMKRRGTHYLIWEKNGRFRWEYSKFKSEWDWPADNSKSYIGRNFDRLSQTAEPLVFLVEGFPTNPRLGDLLPKFELSKNVTNIIKTAYGTGRVAEEIGSKKADNLLRILPFMTFILVAVMLIIVVGVFINLTELSDLLAEIKPHIPAAIEALQNRAKEI